ncbi:peptidase [Paracoccus homiensis]|uniref:Putative phage cell wall peptidase, NlpC/P60 family n=1 Tax=Paracoccus homiensis TaxID=364199 RepID=A0A1I0CE23_9RHOB|nr:peptidase [Paracoccus homiensis]SET17171.1 putative phage cell wall peptidase, NlpC/P60 family [Paracoccus homiensis]
MTDRVVAIARMWIGTPYMHQASVQGVGADCLGLIRGIWRQLYGAEPETAPAYTADWGECSSHELLLQGACRNLVRCKPDCAFAPGDVLLFRMRPMAVAKHLGVLSEIGATRRFVHAYSGHGVVESPLSAPWQGRIAGRFRFP